MNWPDIVHLGRVQDVARKGSMPKGSMPKGSMPKGSMPKGSMPSIDLLCGGSPCQDLSSANTHGAGLSGARSGLFWEYVRVLRAVRPRFFLFENVYSMASVHRDAISRALGVAPVLLNASAFSAQSRRRLFWTNIPLTAPPASCGLVLRDILQHGPALAAAKPSVLPLADFVPETHWRNSGDIHTVGNVRDNTYSTAKVYADSGKSATLRCDSRQYYRIGRRVRRLTLTEVERLQGLPDGYTACMGAAKRRRHGIGNGFSVHVVRWILSHLPRLQAEQPRRPSGRV
jgi:DNA (cytosine-5)-methyltransferase 3A